MDVPVKIPLDQWNAIIIKDAKAIANQYPELLKLLLYFRLHQNRNTFNKFILESAKLLSKKQRSTLILSIMSASGNAELTIGIAHWVVQKLITK